MRGRLRECIRVSGEWGNGDTGTRRNGDGLAVVFFALSEPVVNGNHPAKAEEEKPNKDINKFEHIRFLCRAGGPA